jgi:hypothetical protein
MNERPGQTVEEEEEIEDEEDTDDDEAEAESSNTLETNPTPRHADREQGFRRERNIDR